jgi:hypothetical protein
VNDGAVRPGWKIHGIGVKYARSSQIEKETIMKRRQYFIAFGLVAVAMPFALGCGAAPQTETTTVVATEEASTTASDQVELLFVQTADSATLADGVLMMGGVNPATIYFSDRPNRVAGHLTTEEFVATWGDGDDSFASNPPNATLSILTGDNPQEIVVVLTEPRIEDGNLVYNVNVLEGAEAATGGACSLFIDIIGMPLTPVSYAGVARRTMRRAVIY